VIDRSSMPPALVRRSLPFAWPGAAALLALCMAVVWLVPPALR
jgi:hypothetical protein